MKGSYLTMKTNDMTPKNDFGNWLLNNILENNMTCSDVANRLLTTRQCVRNHINGDVVPSYVWVIAYCSLFNDNPTIIWKMVKRD